MTTTVLGAIQLKAKIQTATEKRSNTVRKMMKSGMKLMIRFSNATPTTKMIVLTHS